MATLLPPPLIVVADTNVPLDLAAGRDVVLDAVAEIQRRLRGGKLLIPPTVAKELAYLSRFAEEPETRTNAARFLRHHREWDCQLVNYVPLGEELIERAAMALRASRLLPANEVNDSLILVEGAALHASLLLTTDEHLRGLDFQRLKFVLEKYDLSAPVIATPREIVQKFLP